MRKRSGISQKRKLKKTSQDRIKVLRIIARMNVGGPAVQVTGLMKALNPDIFEQKLVTGFVGPNERDYLSEKYEDLNFVRIDGLGRSIKPFSDFVVFFRLVKIIREFKPDLIHTHTAKAGVLGRTAWIFLGYKPALVHTFHGHLLHGYFGVIKTKLIIIIEQALGAITDLIFVVGKKVSEDLLKVGIGNELKVTVMPPGLQINSLYERGEICKNFNLDPALFYCTFLGRVTEIKKPLRILEIAEEIEKMNTNVHFLIAGSGELIEECGRLIREKNLPVTLLGWVSEVEKILSITDLMLLTSENEGMPLSLIQAGMAGKPAIATNVGSVSEVIVDGITGYVLDYDRHTFSQLIASVTKDPTKLRAFGEAGRVHTLKKFSTDRLASDHQEAYLRILN